VTAGHRRLRVPGGPYAAQTSMWGTASGPRPKVDLVPPSALTSSVRTPDSSDTTMYAMQPLALGGLRSAWAWTRDKLLDARPISLRGLDYLARSCPHGRRPERI